MCVSRSDVDLVVLLPKNMPHSQKMPRPLYAIADRLRRTGTATEVEVVAHASVPIVKVRVRLHVSTNKAIYLYRRARQQHFDAGSAQVAVNALTNVHTNKYQRRTQTHATRTRSNIQTKQAQMYALL